MAEKKNINEPVEVWSSERYQKNRENNQARLKQYRDAWYRAKDWDYVYSSPSWERTNVLLDWSLLTDEHKDRIQQKRYEKWQERINQANNWWNIWWQTAGTTVPQNTQNAAQNQNGTSVSNGDTNTRKYDWTDGNGNITVWPQNANLNYYQYWDDSNPNQQWQRGWMNAKYTGEWVSNSYIEYNPDITLADLDPNYLYWENARQQNRKEAWYIARRNDMIASALYNEWKVSREDVANFLSQQNEWMNSTEADRLNTIESVWKRLWQIQPEQPEVDLSKAEDIVKDTSGKIYWKTTAEEWNPKQWIDTSSDDNSVFKAMQESRVKSLQDFVSQDVSNIAVAIAEWVNTWSEQTWRDAQKYYPDFIAAVNAKVKEIRTQQNVTAIASGWEMTTSAANWQSNANTEIANFWASNATWTKSSVEITKDVHNALAQNQTANEASETMASIEEDMAILKNRLKNLREEANSKFKWDAPDYLVNAYMNNKAQEIQNQMQILEDRYNAAYTRYKTEIAQTQWEKEFQLKKDQLDLQRDELALKEYQVKNWLSTTSSNSTSATKNEWDSFEVTTKTDEEVSKAVDTLYEMFDNWQLGNAQCAAWIQTYYLPMLWITLPSLSSLERKKALINEDENYVPKRWDLIIINSGAKLEDWTPAWHIGIVLEVHKDWTVEYMDWNGKSNEKVAINGININSKSILWFRNVNKWQGQTSWWWTDYDYTRFEQYRDATSKSEKETIAAEYWTDVQWMNNIVRDALENRPEKEQTSTTEEIWYDDELWYNPYDKEIYDQIISDKLTLEDWAKKTWLSEQELRRRVLNYQNARSNWVDAYDDGSRNIDEKYWFNLDKKMVYQKIANMWWVIPWTQKATVLQELWLNPRDPNAMKKALDETAKWQEWQKQELDSQALDSLRAIEYIIMQDATRPQRIFAASPATSWADRLLSWEAASRRNSYKYIRDKLTLDYLVDLKNRWATFWALSNQELDAIWNAASLVMYDDEANRFRNNVNNLYNELRKDLWYEELSEEELNKMRWAESTFWWWNDNEWNFDNFITITKDPKTKKWKQNIVPQRNAWLDMWNRWTEDNSWDWANVLDDVLNN